MEELSLSSWNEFPAALNQIREKYGTYRRDFDSGQMIREVSILYRGQANKDWPLSTTLERRRPNPFSVIDYMRLVGRIQPEIQSFTGARWDVPGYLEMEREIVEKQEPIQPYLPAYDFLVHLRHHGFPSPLLDWSESPYIAAFFAYESPGMQDRAIYCYIERPKLVKGWSSGHAMVTVMGPYVTTHKRHFQQRARYTVATRYTSERHEFCAHSDVFDATHPGYDRNAHMQDVCIKIILPAGSRPDALRALNDFNINHFTLFQSEDSLIKAIEMKQFDLSETS